MCNCFQNIKLFFKESNQSIRFRVPLPLGCFSVGRSFPSKHSCHPALGQASPQSWDRVRVQMAQSCQNSQPAPPAQVPRQAFGTVLDSSAALHRAPAGNTTTPAFPPLFTRLPILHQTHPAALFTLTHTHKPSQGQGLTNWASTDTASHCRVLFITDTDSENKNKPMVPAPWVLVPHTKKDAPKRKEPMTAHKLWLPCCSSVGLHSAVLV